MSNIEGLHAILPLPRSAWQTLVSLILRLKDLLGPVARVEKKKKRLADYSQADTLVMWYESVNFATNMSLVSPNWSDQID